MTAKLQDVMQAFLVGRLGCESIDALKPAGATGTPKHADYFLANRRIVIELKSLEDDRVAPIRELLTKWSREPDWPKFSGTRDIQDVLKLHPRGLELNATLSRKVAAVVGRASRNANEQIATTARIFGLDSPMGVLILLNDTVDVLEPRIIASALTPLMRPGPVNGPRPCPRIDTVIIFSWAHFMLNPGGQKQAPVGVVTSDAPERAPAADSLAKHVIREWAAFLNHPLTNMGSISSPVAFNELPFVGRTEPKTFDLDQLGE